MSVLGRIGRTLRVPKRALLRWMSASSSSNGRPASKPLTIPAATTTGTALAAAAAPPLIRRHAMSATVRTRSS